MLGIHHERRETCRPQRIRAARPGLEVLEGRLLLYATTGARWPQPIRVTYSIITDGTSIGGVPSNLAATLGGQAGWEQQIQKAAATWAAVAGINLVRVADNGAPIGSGSYQQGDPGFGDIRIGGMAQSGNQLGFAFAPPAYNGGSNAGDIFLNTSKPWRVDGNTYDVLTVAIHEFGHALGMGHSDIYSADMYAYYSTRNQSLTSDDIDGFRSIYGPRQGDAFDGQASNNSSSYATDITPYVGWQEQITLTDLDILRNDVDWYRVTVPASTSGSMAIRMQSSSLSSLGPQIELYTERREFMGRVSASDSFGDTVGGTVGGVRPGQVFYIKAMPATSGPSSTGRYGLLVNFGHDWQADIAPPDTAVAAQPDHYPTAYPMGEGWEVGGRFIPYMGILDAAQGILDYAGGQLPFPGIFGPIFGSIRGLTDGLVRITYGELSGFGQTELVVGDPAGHVHDRGVTVGGEDDANHRGDDPFTSLGVPDAKTRPGVRNMGAGLVPFPAVTSSLLQAGATAGAGAFGPQAVDAVLAAWHTEGQAETTSSFDGESLVSFARDGTRLRGRRRAASALTQGL